MADDEKTTTTVVETKPGRRPRTTFISRYYPSHSRHLFSLLLTLLLLAGTIALVLYLVYRPPKPRFTVTSAAIYDLTPSSSAAPLNTVSTSIQLTVVARNPNDHGSIAYDGLAAYITYRNHPITQVVRLPPLAQERDSAVAVSPVLGGQVPVSGEVAAGLGVDRGYGVVELRFVMVGRVKYRSGPFRSGWNQLYVRCDVLVGVKRSGGGGVGGQVPLIGDPQCKVDA